MTAVSISLAVVCIGFGMWMGLDVATSFRPQARWLDVSYLVLAVCLLGLGAWFVWMAATG
jgi:hypothetical protein